MNKWQIGQVSWEQNCMTTARRWRRLICSLPRQQWSTIWLWSETLSAKSTGNIRADFAARCKKAPVRMPFVIIPLMIMTYNCHRALPEIFTRSELCCCQELAMRHRRPPALRAAERKFLLDFLLRDVVDTDRVSDCP